MGEYLHKNGGAVKIGTCENLYYYRYEDFKKERFDEGEAGKAPYLKPNVYRFRFPFPDEDNISPGEYKEHNKGLLFIVPKLINLDIMDHKEIFIRTDTYITEGAPAMGMQIPCPMGEHFPKEIQLFDWQNARNNHIFELVQQKPIINEMGLLKLWTVIRCPYCHEMVRIDAEEVGKIMKYVTTNPAHFTDVQKEAVKRMYNGYLG
jgi:hypothetical protein